MSLLHKEHPLDGVFARLDRAEGNIRDLDDRLRDFGHKHPEVFDTQFDPQSRKFSHDVTFAKNPGYWVPVRAGEILFLLRSALDHVITQWLIPRTPAADLDKVLESCYFPIYVTGHWPSFDWTKIPGATPELRAAISECQPCNRADGNPAEDHPLAVLASMNNTDKHRLLLVTVVKPLVYTTIGPEFKGTIETVGQPYIPGSSDVSGHVQAPVIIGCVADGGQMDVQFLSATTIAFKKVGTRQGEPVVQTLDHLALFVRQLITRFGLKFFP